MLVSWQFDITRNDVSGMLGHLTNQVEQGTVTFTSGDVQESPGPAIRYAFRTAAQPSDRMTTAMASLSSLLDN